MGTTQSGNHDYGMRGYIGRWGRSARNEEMCAENDKQGGWLGETVTVKLAEMQNMPRHVIRIAMVLRLSG
jgi:hypothetical protein